MTLEDYPLPDGSWKWVSRGWMIDMRGDGQVQYDGFEYSRSFRSKHWGPSPGVLSNRGLVRRRRWLRQFPARVRRRAKREKEPGRSEVSMWNAKQKKKERLVDRSYAQFSHRRLCTLPAAANFNNLDYRWKAAEFKVPVYSVASLQKQQSSTGSSLIDGC